MFFKQYVCYVHVPRKYATRSRLHVDKRRITTDFTLSIHKETWDFEHYLPVHNALDDIWE